MYEHSTSPAMSEGQARKTTNRPSGCRSNLRRRAREVYPWLWADSIRVRTFVCFDFTDLIVGAQRLATRPKSSRNEPSSVLFHFGREVCHTYTLHAGVRPADKVLYCQQSGEFDQSMGSAATVSISENILRGCSRRLGYLYGSHPDVQVACANTAVREGIRHAAVRRSVQPQGRGSSSNHTHRSLARASPSRLSGHSTTTPKTAHDRERCWDGEWSLKLRRSLFWTWHVRSKDGERAGDTRCVIVLPLSRK